MRKQLLVLLLVWLGTGSAHAQWVQTNGPYGGKVNCLAVSPAAGGTGGTNLFAGTDGGVFLSTNNGTSWTNIGLTNTIVFALAVSPAAGGTGGTNLFAGTSGAGVFLSTNNGTSWTAVNMGLTNTYVQSLAISGTNLFAGTNGGGVFLSTNNGTSWTAVNTGLTNTYVWSLAVSGTNLFAGTSGGVFLSTNNGTSWTAVNTGLTNTRVLSLAISGTNLFAGTYGGGVFLSTNNGTSWTQVNTGLTDLDVRSLAISGTNLFAGTYGGGVFLSTNNGTSWTATGLTNTWVLSLAVSGTNLFAGTLGGVFLSTNNGTSWTAVNTGLTNTDVRSLAVSGTNLFAGTSGGGVFLSNNNRTSWTAVNTGLTNTIVWSLAVSGTNLFAGTGGGGVFLSTNNGTSWTAVNTGLTYLDVWLLAVSGTNLFAGTYGGVFLSTNNGTSWTRVNTGLTNTTVYALAVSGTNLFAGTNGGGVYLSTNNGASWTAVNTGLTSTYVYAFAVSPAAGGAGGTNLFAGTAGGVFLSTNNGTSWTSASGGLTNTRVLSLAVSGTNLFAGTGGGGVFLSTNNGTSWTAVNTGLPQYTSVYALAVSGTNLFAGTFGGGVWRRPLSEMLLTTPTLSSPANGATNQPTTLTLAWNAVTGATRYRLQVSTSSVFTTTVLDDSTITTTSRQVGPLANNTSYYWRVAAGNASGWGEFSSPYIFTAGLAAPTLSSPANGATNQPTALTLAWSAVTGATRYRLQVSTSSAFTTTVLDDSTITTTSRQVGPLANNTTYYWRVAAGNTSGWSEFSSPYTFTTGLAAPALSSPANGAANQPTTLTLSWSAVSGATSYRLQVSTNQNFSPTIFDDSTITTTSRQVGPLAYNTNYYWRVSAKSTGGTGAYSAPWSFTTASDKLVTSPGISFPSDPTNSTDYRLVSFPGASSLRVGDLLSGNQSTDWRIFREIGSPPPNNLLELGSNSFFSIGEGYWLIKKGTFSFSRSVTMPQLSGDGTYTISVRNGWNIIGNPFDAGIPWSSIQSANGTSNRLWSYEGTSGFVSTSTLEPFRGYYFYSNQTTLKIPYPFPSLKHDSPPAPPIDWQLQLALRTAENEDRQNYVGISPAARETVDELDEPKPPVLSGQAALVFSRPEWNTRVRAFSSDFRPAVGEGQEWEFIVTHQKRGTGCITFSGVRDIPPEYDVVLINEQNTAPFDLRRSAEYSFQIVADTMRFRLVVGTKEYVQRRKAAFVPLEFDVSQNFPNPFNAYTMMKYQLPRPVRVQIDIFSVLGQRVKTLASGLHEAGFYTVVWDGTDDTRNAVASGVYFFRILVDDKPFRLLKAVLMK